MAKILDKKKQDSYEWLETKKAVVHLGQALYHAVGLIKNLLVTHDSRKAMKLAFDQIARNDTPEQKKKLADDKEAFLRKDASVTWRSLMNVNRHTLGTTMSLMGIGVSASMKAQLIPLKIMAPVATARATKTAEPAENLHRPTLTPLNNTYKPSSIQAKIVGSDRVVPSLGRFAAESISPNRNLNQSLRNTRMPTRLQAMIPAQRRLNEKDKNKDKEIQQTNFLRPKPF